MNHPTTCPERPISPLRRSLGGTGRFSAVSRFGLTVTACYFSPRA
jgi:hypothetical protein